MIIGFSLRSRDVGSYIVIDLSSSFRLKICQNHSNSPSRICLAFDQSIKIFLFYGLINVKDFNRKIRNYKRFLTRMAFIRDPIDATIAFVALFASGSLLICLLLDILKQEFLLYAFEFWGWELLVTAPSYPRVCLVKMTNNLRKNMFKTQLTVIKDVKEFKKDLPTTSNRHQAFRRFLLNWKFCQHC